MKTPDVKSPEVQVKERELESYKLDVKAEIRREIEIARKHLSEIESSLCSQVDAIDYKYRGKLKLKVPAKQEMEKLWGVQEKLPDALTLFKLLGENKNALDQIYSFYINKQTTILNPESFSHHLCQRVSEPIHWLHDVFFLPLDRICYCWQCQSHLLGYKQKLEKLGRRGMPRVSPQLHYGSSASPCSCSPK